MASVATSDEQGIRRVAEAIRATLTSFRWPVVFISGYALLALGWASAVGITISGASTVGLLVAWCFTLGIVLTAAGKIIPNNLFSTALKRIGIGAAWFALGGAGAALMEIFILPCNRLALPFNDATYARMDAALGFSWPHWALFLKAHPLLDTPLSFAYYAFIPQYFLVYFVLAMLNDRQRAAEFFWSANLAGVIICLVSGLIPAMGAAAYFLHASESWTRDLLAARQYGPTTFVLAHIAGIAQMPSYHGAMAGLLIWSSRRTGLFGWAVAALNLTMLAGTPFEGSHYLVDVLAGLGIVGATMYAVHRVLYGSDRSANVPPGLPKLKPAGSA